VQAGARRDHAVTLAPEAKPEWRGTLSPAMGNHSIRTVVFGPARSELDGKPVDLEEVDVRWLLDHLALESPTPGRCFEVVDAARPAPSRRAARPRRSATLGSAWSCGSRRLPSDARGLGTET
jgi:hypothetical protein